MDFFTEFLPQIWPLILFLVVSMMMLVAILVTLRSQRQKKRQLEKQQALGIEPTPQKKQSASKSVVDSYAMDDDDDDPLAVLNMARQEAYQEMPDEDLSHLLATMGEPPLHRVASEPIQVKLNTGNQTQARELLSVMRDETDGRLMIQIGETAFRTLTTDANAKAEFTRIMKELSGIILKPDDAPTISEQNQPAPPVVAPPVAAKPVPTPAPTPAKPVVTPPPPVVDEAVEEDVSETIEAAKKLEATERLPGDLPDMRLKDNPDNYKKDRFGRISVKRVDKAPEINIAEAIEAYLQYKIERAPEFQMRGVHIRPTFSGGIRIEAEGKTYDFVDEVEDPAIRKLLQDTIAEWQERH